MQELEREPGWDANPCGRLAWLPPVRELAPTVQACSRIEPELGLKWAWKDAPPSAPSAPPHPLSLRPVRGLFWGF